MFRSIAVTILLSGLVGGCVAGAQQRPLSPVEQKLSDQLVRPQFARLIAGHRKFGTSNLFSGRREYLNAQVSGPALEDNTFGSPSKRICAKVLIKNAVLGIDRQVDLSADVTEANSRLGLRMGPDEDMFGSRCKGPFVPFPELEAMTRRGV